MITAMPARHLLQNVDELASCRLDPWDHLRRHSEIAWRTSHFFRRAGCRRFHLCGTGLVERAQLELGRH